MGAHKYPVVYFFFHPLNVPTLRHNLLCRQIKKDIFRPRVRYSSLSHRGERRIIRQSRDPSRFNSDVAIWFPRSFILSQLYIFVGKLILILAVRHTLHILNRQIDTNYYRFLIHLVYEGRYVGWRLPWRRSKFGVRIWVFFKFWSRVTDWSLIWLPISGGIKNTSLTVVSAPESIFFILRVDFLSIFPQLWTSCSRVRC